MRRANLVEIAGITSQPTALDQSPAKDLTLNSITNNGVFTENANFLGLSSHSNYQLKENNTPEEANIFTAMGYLLVKGKLLYITVTGKKEMSYSIAGLARLKKWSEDILTAN